MPVQSSDRSLANAVNALRLLLGIQDFASLHCHGTTKKHRCCSLRSLSTSKEVETRLACIIALGNAKVPTDLLEDLASSILCRTYHQDQSADLVIRWRKILRHVTVPYIKSEDEDDVVDLLPSIRRCQKMIEALKPMKDESKSSEASKPSKIKNEPVTADSRRQNRPRNVSSSDPRTSTRLATHNFRPYGSPKSTYERNLAIEERLAQPLTKRQLRQSSPQPLSSSTSPSGSVYIYTFPDRYRGAAPPLKIGHSSNVDARMADWRRLCGYEPKLLCTFEADLHVRVERLVHAQLGNARQKEVGCPGCGGKHVEWFDVSFSVAAGVVGLWTQWTRRQPFDEQGKLKAKWRKRLDDVDLEDPDCWEDFVNGR